MKAIEKIQKPTEHRTRKQVLLVLWLLTPLTLFAGGVVTSCTEANLRAAMVGGGSVTFACDGTITLTSTITNNINTTLDASGHQITISGKNAVRVFYVASNATFVAKNLRIANGRSSLGAGIFNEGGTITLSGVVVESNYADSFDQSTQMFIEAAEGGGVFNQYGAVHALGCIFRNNTAFKPPDDITSTNRLARGGAIRNLGGEVHLQDCVFLNNQAVGAPPMGPWLSPGRDGFGGAIHNSGQLTAVTCGFLGNSARGEPAYTSYPAAAGGSGTGGAIYNTGDLVLMASTVANNRTSGGMGGFGPGGCVMTCPGNPSPGGPGSSGGSALGGGLYNAGTGSAVNCTIVWNSCVGGAGGPGGNGGSATLPYVRGTDGGPGGSGGPSFGGGIFGSLLLTNCTLAFNSVVPGPGGAGGAGGSAMPPSYAGQPGAPGTGGWAAGGGFTGGLVVNTLLATNQPSNNSEALTDLGHNLSSDGSCAFTNVGSLNNTDPKLGPLADNGGPTLTMALLAGSPAIDTGSSAAAPSTDQRGITRPFGAAPDIGAYEYAPLLKISRTPGNGLDILLRDGSPGQTCRLLTSTNFSDWCCIATNQVGANGTLLFETNCSTSEPQRLYKAVLP